MTREGGPVITISAWPDKHSYSGDGCEISLKISRHGPRRKTSPASSSIVASRVHRSECAKTPLPTAILTLLHAWLLRRLHSHDL
jgi:hypothetical protein